MTRSACASRSVRLVAPGRSPRSLLPPALLAPSATARGASREARGRGSTAAARAACPPSPGRASPPRRSAGGTSPSRTVTTCGTVIASSPSAPCVTPQPLAPRPPNGVAGCAVGASTSLIDDVPGGDARGQFLRGVDVGGEDRRGQAERATASPSDTASSSVSNGMTAATGAKHASRQIAASGGSVEEEGGAAESASPGSGRARARFDVAAAKRRRPSLHRVGDQPLRLLRLPRRHQRHRLRRSPRACGAASANAADLARAARRPAAPRCTSARG